jgi:hypothetical protein
MSVLEECQVEEAKAMDELIEKTKQGTLLASNVKVNAYDEPNGFEIFAVPTRSDPEYIWWDHNVNDGRYPWECDSIEKVELSQVLFNLAGPANHQFRTPAGDELVRRVGEELVAAVAAILNECRPGPDMGALRFAEGLPSNNSKKSK